VPSEYLVGIFAHFALRSIPIPNLIEIDKFVFRARSPLRPVFLSIRNLESHYGVDLVLRAFALIQEQVPGASLLVVGDGSQRGSLERLAQDLGLRNIRFTGKISPDAIIERYDDTDVFLNGSEIDNQPLSILEAFACGLPVVTTNAGGIPYIVTNESTGLVVSCGDYEGMAECALRLLRDPQLAVSISEHARDECRNYSWSAVRQRWLDLYYGLTSSVGAEQKQKGPLASQQNVVGR